MNSKPELVLALEVALSMAKAEHEATQLKPPKPIPIASPQKLAEAIVDGRDKLSLSRRTVCSETGLSSAMVKNLEEGKAKGIAELFELCDYLGLKLCIKP